MIASKKFWKKKKIFLTGHTSFKGSWLKLWLEYLGAKVTGYSIDFPSRPLCLFRILFKEKLKPQSILNYNLLIKKIKDSQNQIVFHFAAQSILSRAYSDPLETYNTNIIGTASVLEACSNVSKVKTVVIITTDKCYQENKSLKFYTEKSQLGGSEPYSASKACAELISSSYAQKYKSLNKKIITLRAGNVIGGGDWKKNRIVPDFINSKFENKKLKLRNPHYVRPWLNVLDCINGYLLATEYSYKSIKTFNSWNFAPMLKNQISVLELTNLLYSKFGKKIYINKKKTVFYESERLNLNSNKAKKELKWKTILNKDNSINFIYEWYINFFNGKKMDIISKIQIKNFYKLATNK